MALLIAQNTEGQSIGGHNTGQSFVVTSASVITSVKLRFRTYSGFTSENSTLKLKIQKKVGVIWEDESETVILTGAGLVGNYPTFNTNEFTFTTQPTLAIGTTYRLHVYMSDTGVVPTGYCQCSASSANPYAGGLAFNNAWTELSDYDLWFEIYGDELLPEKPINPSPEDEEEDVVKTTANISWEDGGAGEANAADSYDVHFGTESGNLTELASATTETEWNSPYVVLEINDYNPATGSGLRSPVAGDELTHGDTTYTLWDVKRGQLVNTQYEAKLYAFREGPSGSAGDVLTNGSDVSVTLNDSWHFSGEVESTYYPYATRMYWRIDATNIYGTTTGDEWYFDTEQSWRNERPPDYDEEKYWQYKDDEYQWDDGVVVAGGGRYCQQLVAIGHNCVYYGNIT
jgi:hypothetical protein